MDELKPVMWMKLKHRQPKTVGRQKGGTSASSKKRERHSASIKTEHAVRATERVMVLDFTEGRRGKLIWKTREKPTK